MPDCTIGIIESEVIYRCNCIILVCSLRFVISKRTADTLTVFIGGLGNSYQVIWNSSYRFDIHQELVTYGYAAGCSQVEGIKVYITYRK